MRPHVVADDQSMEKNGVAKAGKQSQPGLSPGKTAFLKDPQTVARLHRRHDQTMQIKLLGQLSAAQAQKHDFLVEPINGDKQTLLLAQQAWLQLKTAKYRAPDRYLKCLPEFMRSNPWRDFQTGAALTSPDARRAFTEAQPMFRSNLLKGEWYVGLETGKEKEFLAFAENNPVFKHHFQLYFDGKIKALEQASIDVGLKPEQHIELIDAARKHNRETGATSAYFHPYEAERPGGNGVAVDGAHADAYIITPEKLLALVPFGFDTALAFNDYVDVHTANIEDFVTADSGNRKKSDAAEQKRFSPQASRDQCGTMVLAYVKELLKDDAKQLKDYTLTATRSGDLDQDGYEEGATRFFLPSPHVLRYSQSGLYIDILRAMVESKRPAVTVRHGTDSYEVKTLQSLADDGMSLESGEGKPMSADDLNQFRQRWINVLDTCTAPKRDMMVLAVPDPKASAGNSKGENATSANKQINVSLDYRHLKYLGKLDQEL